MDPLDEEDSSDYDKGREFDAPDADMADALAALDNANQVLNRHTSVSGGQVPSAVSKPLGDVAPHLAESYEDMSDAFSPKRPTAEPYEVMQLGHP
jgi:hypothetical protein